MNKQELIEALAGYYTANEIDSCVDIEELEELYKEMINGGSEQ